MRGIHPSFASNLPRFTGHLFILGNLALSRALGDFVFKRNPEKSAEEQIVTGMFTDTVHFM